MNLASYYYSCIRTIEKGKDVPLIIMRIILAHGFYGPAMMKLQHLHQAAEMFASVGIPAPLFNTYLVASTEMLGAILLIMGLGTRFITIPLMIVMLVAIAVVHWTSGFAAGNNGYEIPFYYFIMLFTLFIYGPSRVSVDQLIKNKQQEEGII